VRPIRGGATTLGSILADGSVGSISLRSTDVDGAGVQIDGSLRNFRATSLTNGADLDIDPDDSSDLVRIRLDTAIGTDADPIAIETTGGIRELRVGSRAEHVRVSAGDDLRRLRLDEGADHFTAEIPGLLHRTRIDGDLRDSVIAAAGGMGIYRVRGDLIDSHVLAGTLLDDQHTLADATFGVATIRRIVIDGRVIDSILAAGGDPGADDRFESGEVLAGGRIEQLRIGGELIGVDSPHVNPGVYAAELGHVHVNGLNLGGGPIPEGLGVVGSAVIDPLPMAPNSLTVLDIETILARAITQAQELGVNATISLMDREGNFLAVVRTTDGALPPAPLAVDIDAAGIGGLEAVDGIVPTSLIAATKAGTAAFLSTSRGNAFTTRTAGAIIQKHFPAGTRFQDSGPLFGVQLSSLPTSDVNRLPLGVSADPGGLPLYRGLELVGGIGVEVDGVYTVDPTGVGGQTTAEEAIALAGQAGFTPPARIRADRIFADGIRLDYANGRAPAAITPAPYATFVGGGLVDELIAPVVSPAVSKFELASIITPNGTVIIGEVPNNPLVDLYDDIGMALDYQDGDLNLGEQLTAADVQLIIEQAHQLNHRLRAMIRRDVPQRSQVTVSVVDHNGNLLGVLRNRDAPVFGFDVSVQKARTAAFFSRPDAGTQIRDLDGEVDIAGLNTAVPGALVGPTAYSRHADAAAAIGVDLDGSVAVADRTGGFLSRPNLPDGIDTAPPGPFTAQSPDAFSPFNTGLQTALVLPELAEFLVAVGGMAEATALSMFASGLLGGGGVTPLDSNLSALNPGGGLPVNSLANGMQIFAGSVPLYKNGVLVGGVGVSGDGIEQDDFVAFSGAAGFQDFGPTVTRADSVFVAGGIRLPYIKLPRSPFL